MNVFDFDKVHYMINLRVKQCKDEEHVEQSIEEGEQFDRSHVFYHTLKWNDNATV